ncbi:MAG: DUF2184 domain-containing protein [Deltaproteobacteria bacterium]|nr:DUF2184 domain-containing protein [Deltaproteobacteria bacterium]
MDEKIIARNLDANESAFFARELEHIKAKTYDIRYPEYKAMRLIPVSSDAGSGAETIKYQQFDSVGIMKIVANYGDDLPRSDVFGSEFTATVKSLGGSFGYTLQEVRAGAMAGRPLPAKKASAARKSYEQAVNRIAWFGDAKAGLLGMLIQPSIPAAVASTGATTSTIEWATKNADEILVDLNAIVTDMIELTLGVEVPDTILLPIAQHAIISTRARSATSDTTILEFFLKNRPEIKSVEWVNELKDVTPLPSGDSGTKDVMIAYKKNIDKLDIELPQQFEQLSVQEKGLEYVVPTHARIGGVIVYYPLSMSIMEGI